MYNEAIIKIQLNEAYDNECTLHAFIPHYMEAGKYELVKKLGFNCQKFKKSGGDLFISSLEIDFNYPVKYTNELIIRLSLLDIYDSQIRIVSMIYNQKDSLVAKAISTLMSGHKNMNSNLNLCDYFEIIENEIEEEVTY